MKTMEGMERLPERRKEGVSRRTNEEEVLLELENILPETNIEQELENIRTTLRDIADLSREARFRLEVRRAALLEYRRRHEPLRPAGPTTLDELDDVPHLSGVLELRYPRFDVTREGLIQQQEQGIVGERGGDTKPFVRKHVPRGTGKPDNS